MRNARTSSSSASSKTPYVPRILPFIVAFLTGIQDKCTEAILELNKCLEARLQRDPPFPFQTYVVLQGIIQADAHVKTAADLVTKYRKNVQYNLAATRSAAHPDA